MKGRPNTRDHMDDRSIFPITQHRRDDSGHYWEEALEWPAGADPDFLMQPLTLEEY